MSNTATAKPDTDLQDQTVEKAETRRDERPKKQPRYHVILWDDNDHSYDYVIRMMKDLFGHPAEKGYELAREVDTAGRTVCLTTTLEHAELKRDQVHAFGRDRLIARCKGSMTCTLEAER